MDAKPKAEKILRELNFDFHAFTIEKFIGYVGDKKGRSIIVAPWKMPATMFGAWLSDGEEPKEYIFYRDNVPLLLQIHIQLHELAHLLLGHPTLQITRQLISKGFQGEKSLRFEALVRLRSPDKTELETEAETLATIIQERVIRYSQLDQLTHDISSEEKIANFLRTMGLTS